MLFLASPAIANNSDVNVNAIYTGRIYCLDPQEAKKELLNSVIWDCSRYNMEPTVFVPTIGYDLCKNDTTKINIYFMYKCTLKVKEI